MKTTTQIQYQTLAAGDVRQEGDQFRAKPFQTGRDVNSGHLNNPQFVNVAPGMFGKEILQSDMIHLEFRRPL